MKNFSIIVPNYNGLVFLRPCFDSIYEQTFKDYEIIMVDDASTDRSIEFVKSSYPSVRIVQMRKNSGFAKVVNEGIKHARGKYVFLLNNDTCLEQRCLEEINKAIYQNPKFDFFACKILSMTNPNKIDSAGDGYSVIGNPYKIGYKRMDGPKYQKIKEVFGACAAASVYKRTLFDEIGVFDEDFVYYNEDSDINFRARLSGRRCLYISTAIVYHRLSASYKEKLGSVIYYICRNKVNIIIKNLPTILIIKYFPFLVFGRGRDLFIAFIKGKFFSGLRGLLAASKQFYFMLQKRKEIQDIR